jgi:hypothetical protein
LHNRTTHSVRSCRPNQYADFRSMKGPAGVTTHHVGHDRPAAIADRVGTVQAGGDSKDRVGATQAGGDNTDRVVHDRPAAIADRVGAVQAGGDNKDRVGAAQAGGDSKDRVGATQAGGDNTDRVGHDTPAAIAKIASDMTSRPR